MKHFVLIPNEKKDTGLTVSRRVCEVLTSNGGTVCLPETTAARLACPGVTPIAEGTLPPEAELIITVGGDGTVLEASRMAIRASLPILGVNLGRLGYLAEVEPGDVDRLALLTKNDLPEIEERMTLSVVLHHGERDWPLPRCAVNDVVFYRASLGHAVDLTLSAGGAEGIRYLADGLILATPTGSTAYSLSAGGAILDTGVEAIEATPICPHAFFSRSLLFRPDGDLRVTNTSDSDAVTVTLDGKENLLLDPGDSVTVSRAPRSLRILSLAKRDFLETLHLKMKISE